LNWKLASLYLRNATRAEHHRLKQHLIQPGWAALKTQDRDDRAFAESMSGITNHLIGNAAACCNLKSKGR
jgi:hypothetical protein